MAVKSGDTVKVHYTGSLADGTVFDSSKGRDPLEFTLGSGQVIKGFEKAVEGLKPGEKIKVKIPVEEAYGESDPELVFTVDRKQVPENIPLKVGTPIQLANDKSRMDVVITEVGPEEITLDANHPLAGKELEFEIELVEHKPADK